MGIGPGCEWRASKWASGPPVGPDAVRRDVAAALVHDAVHGVVNEPGGTGGQLRLAGIEFSGKSGTAQVIGYGTRDRVGKEKKFEDNAWFVGYAPRRNPEIVVATIIQNGGWGSEAAAPVAHAVLETYYKKKIGQFDGTMNTVAAAERRLDRSRSARLAATACGHP